MKIDTVITLDNDINCLLLEKVAYKNDNYFMSVVLNEEEELTEEYVVFKEIIEKNETYVEKVEEPSLLGDLLKLFKIKVNEFVADSAA